MKEDRGDKVFLDATRAGGATVVSAYSPRVRPGTPVSWPFPWDELDVINPSDHTIKNAIEALDGRDPWSELMPEPQALPADLIAEGHALPADSGRVEAMHEGARRARARRKETD